MSEQEMRLTVPYFITGKTEIELVQNMVKYNMKTNRHHNYHSIQFDGKKWVAWFAAPQRELARKIFDNVKDQKDAKSNTKRYNRGEE